MNFSVGTTNRGLEIFPDDAELLYLAGVMHEALASTAVQEAFRGADYYLRSAVGLSSRRGELNTAEGLFGRALKLTPTLSQARLHLGHVLAEQGEHKKALTELTQALRRSRTRTCCTTATSSPAVPRPHSARPPRPATRSSRPLD
jgi:tetratricopeptide (TPR) repeat protein